MTVDAVLGGKSAVVRVVLSAVSGSAPRDIGAEMFVTQHDIAGTIGGGRLEYIAIDAARKLLTSGEESGELDIPLGPEIGQCCGGRVSVALSRMNEVERSNVSHASERERRNRPHVFIMGSGHVGRALANQIQHLPFNTVLVDQRESELERCEASVERRLSALPENDIATAPASSAFVVLTHDHGLDFMLTAAALQKGDASYVGLIGSATKRAKFESWFRQQDSTPSLGQLVCPIGAGRDSNKRPEIIAALVVAEVTEALCPSDQTSRSAMEQLRETPPRVLLGTAR